MSESKRFWKDFWQLHVPLVLVLALCTSATIIEVGRAAQGVNRAIVYSIQWPLIGLFAIFVWNHYRKHGSLTKSVSKYLRERTERITREAEKVEHAIYPDTNIAPDDPQKQAWERYVQELHEVDPPGGPPHKATEGR